MKKQKLAVVFTALLTMVGFSSCLNSGDDNLNYPSFQLPVTIAGDALVDILFGLIMVILNYVLPAQVFLS